MGASIRRDVVRGLQKETVTQAMLSHEISGPNGQKVVSQPDIRCHLARMVRTSVDVRAVVPG